MTRRNLPEIAATGDRVATLKALRDRLADACERAVDGKELAALGLRLQVVLRELAELEGTGNAEENDDLAARRDAKLRAAAGS